LPFSFVMLRHLLKSPWSSFVNNRGFWRGTAKLSWSEVLRRMDFISPHPTAHPTPQCDSQNHKYAFQLWDSKAGGLSALRSNGEYEQINESMPRPSLVAICSSGKNEILAVNLHHQWMFIISTIGTYRDGPTG